MGYSRYGRGYQWAPYVSVAERRAKAAAHRKAQEKKGHTFNPVIVEGRKIAKTFWGEAWCNNLEAYSDFSNRLPRGRTYVRNGSVIDLQISEGKVKAQVMGSSLYRVEIKISPMPLPQWRELVKACTGKIDSLIELLIGKFSKAVMEIMTCKKNGLFPKPKEIQMSCSCPDSAGMCKHIAAVLYGVGAYLDNQPDGLFILRHVDHLDLVATVSAGTTLAQGTRADNVLEDSGLSALFGIDVEETGPATNQSIPAKKPRGRPRKILVTAEKEKASKKISAKLVLPKDTKKKVSKPKVALPIKSKSPPGKKKPLSPKKTALKKA